MALLLKDLVFALYSLILAKTTQTPERGLFFAVIRNKAFRDCKMVSVPQAQVTMPLLLLLLLLLLLQDSVIAIENGPKAVDSLLAVFQCQFYRYL